MSPLRAALAAFILGFASAGAVSCGPAEAPRRVCDASNCMGCCDTNGECLAGTSVFECGVGGAACFACAANEYCEGGACARFANGDYDASFPDRPDASINYDAGVFVPPDAGVMDAGSTDAGTMNVSYSLQIQPIFDSRCIDCHAWNYDTIVNINGRITPGNLNASAIYNRTATADMPRGGGAPLTTTQVNLIRDWILNGAPRN